VDASRSADKANARHETASVDSIAETSLSSKRLAENPAYKYQPTDTGEKLQKIKNIAWDEND